MPRKPAESQGQGMFDLPAEPDAEVDLADDPAAPLAARMRPRTLDEFAGQEHIIGPGRALRRSIESDRLSSLIFWGPPGTGKTTLAQIIARLTRTHFAALSAVTAGVADLRRVADQARTMRRSHDRRTVLFIDEIHRFNKAQQDATLPFVESGLLCLIGATTENPSFSVNAALLSRSRVFRLESLTDAQIAALIERALADWGVALAFSVFACVGASNAYNLIDGLNGLMAGVALITLAAIEDALQRRAPLYDKTGEGHYDTISAFIKSLRGSDPDAAVYWLARMLESGEDPLFVARRMVILAAEDVGLADPQALQVAVATLQAAQFIGMPEGYLPLTECALYLATAPKSNAVISAYGQAKADVEATRNDPVPLHLRNAPTGLMKSMGYGQDYRYAHTDYQAQSDGGDLPPAERLQAYLPENLAGRAYFQPTQFGREARLRDWIARRRAAAASSDAPSNHPANGA
ncbi:MAG: replication-associated recombination protein A [Chloroflexi bacterium]|nr:replication-associated recombination protein A [Chloroflexota bacterium]